VHYRVRLAASVAVLFLLQAAVAPRFTHLHFRPDLLLLVSAFVALEGSFQAAAWTALCVGLLRDLGSAGPLGLTPLVLVPATVGLYGAREHLVRGRLAVDLALTFAYVFACGLAMSAAQKAGAGTRFGPAGVAFGQALVSTAVAPMLFVVLRNARVAARQEQS
jgi:rod shape-determining protein MreD